MSRIRFLMLGGFLGAGKTTAIARLARHYVDQGKRVAIVTNAGGPGILAADACSAAGLVVEEFSDSTRARLAPRSARARSMSARWTVGSLRWT